MPSPGWNLRSIARGYGNLGPVTYARYFSAGQRTKGKVGSLGSGADIRAEPRAPQTADPQPTEQAGSKGSFEREQRLAGWILLAVGVGYLVAQFAFMPFRRPFHWDEAIYVTQVTPGMDALFFEAWRSRGITLLIAPVTLLGGSVSDVRLFLMVASAATVTLTFRLWIPLIGIAAPIAAFLFSFTWLSLVSGSTVMPNFWAAILGVAVTGLVARRLEGGSLRYALFAAAVLGVVALVRPTEAIVLAGAIGLYVVLIRRTSWRLALGLGLGLALGWLPWLLEMSIRLGGLRNALREANAVELLSGGPVTQNVLSYLAFTYGPAKPHLVGLPVAGLLWWALLVFLVAIALRRQVAAPARSVALLACLATLAYVAEYVVLVPFIQSRFLLPAYAFAAISAAIGIVSLLRSGAAARTVGAVLLLVMIPWAVWQGEVASRAGARELRDGKRLVAAGVLLRDLAGGRPCSFVSAVAFPQIQISSGCIGDRLSFPPRPTAAQRDTLAAGEEVFMILPAVARSPSPLAELSPIPFRGPQRIWFIYRLSELADEQAPSGT